jgi:membrane protein DedA with SNARE-associated domain
LQHRRLLVMQGVLNQQETTSLHSLLLLLLQGRLVGSITCYAALQCHHQHRYLRRMYQERRVLHHLRQQQRQQQQHLLHQQLAAPLKKADMQHHPWLLLHPLPLYLLLLVVRS